MLSSALEVLITSWRSPAATLICFSKAADLKLDVQIRNAGDLDLYVLQKHALKTGGFDDDRVMPEPDVRKTNAPESLVVA